MDAIVYTSNSGFTAEYANMLSAKTGLPVYSLKNAAGKISRNASIVYMGWLMAGSIKGFKKASRRYNISCVCGVGMSGDDSQAGEIKKTNRIPDDVPLFVLQGGFDLSKLHGIYKMMMVIMKKTVGKALQDKPEKSDEESDMLDLMDNGGSRVSEKKLEPVTEWCQNREN